MKRTAYLVMVGVTFGYLVIGAVVFHYLESKNEESIKIQFTDEHEAFLRNNTCLTPEVLHEYVMLVLNTQANGVAVGMITQRNLSANTSLDEELEESGTKWDIASCVLFCITVISTIGYGNIAPKTSGGRLFCIFYAVMGIPMFAAVLVGTGERLQKPIKMVQNGRPWIKNNPSRDEKLKSIVLLTLGVVLIVFIPAAVFTKTQKWSFLESVYYTVITLTTIGFGDLVPGYFDKPVKGEVKRSYVYRVILGFWILLGMSWGALILSEIGTMLQTRISTAASQTQNKLSHLEGIVKKKAKATKDKIIKKTRSKSCEITSFQKY
ncbi:potassium channel subfamily K member 4-like isoform X2 [Physella acuta]|uniref:potassium channel subfamily K member 4-like isoform X2 n=1 Tax=Physella acuta TaxID=109671 RepID=UPI0027DBA920|nr:potassium channel subfamily K member 4-like isoform X2 [Physella acuta]